MSLLSRLLRNAGPTDARKRSVPARTDSLVGSRSTVVIPRNTEPLFQERGWRRSGNALVGYFRTPRGSFQGLIEGADYYIIDPPRALLNGPHGLCFRRRGVHTFLVHWNIAPADVNAGILHIERYLMEALS